MTAFFTGFIGYGTALSAAGVPTEPSDVGYSRASIVFGQLTPFGPVAAVGGGVLGPFLNPQVVGYVGLYDAQVGGNLLCWWPLRLGLNVAAGGIITFQSGAHPITLNTVSDILEAGSRAIAAGAAIGRVGDQPLTSGVAIVINAGVMAAATPTIATAPMPKLRPSLGVPYMPFSYVSGLYAGGTQYTFGVNLQFERPFTGVKLLLANYTTTTQTLAGVCVASSASAASPTTPVDTTGATTTWTAVTFGGSATPTLAAAALASEPSYLLSDLLPIESFARTDGSPFSLLYTRVLSASSGYSVPAASNALVAAINTVDGGRLLPGYSAAGDYVSTAAKQASLTDGLAPTAFAFTYVVGAVFYSESRCIGLMGAGDSLTQGGLTVSGYNGFPRIAVNALSAGACGVSLVDGGWIGQTVALFCARARALLAAGFIPHVMTIPIDSPNDYLDNPGYLPRQAQEATVLSLVDYAESLGVVVILLTSIPFMESGADIAGAQRVISSTKLRALAQRGVLVLDAQAIICGYVPTAARPAVTPASMIASDGSHLNDIGQGLLGGALRNVVAPLLA